MITANYRSRLLRRRAGMRPHPAPPMPVELEPISVLTAALVSVADFQTPSAEAPRLADLALAGMEPTVLAGLDATSASANSAPEAVDAPADSGKAKKRGRKRKNEGLSGDAGKAKKPRRKSPKL